MCIRDRFGADLQTFDGRVIHPVAVAFQNHGIYADRKRLCHQAVEVHIPGAQLHAVGFQNRRYGATRKAGAAVVDMPQLHAGAKTLHPRKGIRAALGKMCIRDSSYNMLPAVRDLNVPVVLVNVQKKKAPDYANTDIPTWLGTLYACGAVGEMVADLERAGKRHAVITGVVEGGDPTVQAEIEDWCRAAQVRRRFRDTNLAQIGRPYPGMMDLYLSLIHI